MNHQIAIDGPAGAGKSTIARRIAQTYSYIYIDTGAMYRAIAYDLLSHGIPGDDAAAVEKVCGSIDVSIRFVDGEQRICLGGNDVTSFLRREDVGTMASISSANPSVRKKMTDLQRRLAQKESVVMDGRDIGTTVLPGAEVKIYLTASAHTRALRRHQELQMKGITSDLAQIEEEINQRDIRDKNREVSPLKKAEDACLLDTSEMDIEQAVQAALAICKEKLGEPAKGGQT